MNYSSHQCEPGLKKNIQMPVCPLCKKPVPTPRGQKPDCTVGEHIDNDCRVAESKKIFTNHCTVATCSGKEAVPVLCSECRQNYCFKHRHPSDHSCSGDAEMAKKIAESNNPFGIIVKKTFTVTSIQGAMSEDEALAKALAESKRLTRRNLTNPAQRCCVS
ncbi:AN1-type zinc finger protein 2B-like isoform X2 [Adelges cooleyi]|nr:AN1-type zinc finger protein 2B-like isoform X2 [Adelges cooleyi]